MPNVCIMYIYLGMYMIKLYTLAFMYNKHLAYMAQTLAHFGAGSWETFNIQLGDAAFEHWETRHPKGSKTFPPPALYPGT